MITRREDPVIAELTSTLREWHQLWISLYLDNQTELFDKISSLIVNLIDQRNELLDILKQNPYHDFARREQQIKLDVIDKIDLGNRLLGLAIVPRDADFAPVNPIHLSPIKLYQVHSEASINGGFTGTCNATYGYHESTISTTGSSVSTLSQISSDTNQTSAGQLTTSHHLDMNLQNFHLASLPPDEQIEIHFSIVEVTSNNSNNHTFKPISDKFIVQIHNDELVCGVSNSIFTNLGALANRDLCLYIQVYRIGKMLLADGFKTTFAKQQHNLQQSNSQEGSTSSVANNGKYHSNGLSRARHSTIGYFNTPVKYKRPFGANLVLLKEHMRSSNLFRETNITARVISSSESDFSQMNELFPKRNMPLKINQNLANIQLDLTVKFITGTQESITKLIKDIPYCITEKRGFPDMVMPGDFKNDLYFTLESAEFEKGGKSIPKNIEATISLIDKSGLVMDKCISPGSNCDNISTYKSCVYYHSNSPKWNESIKINVPLIEFDSAHIRVEFRHCSTKEREKKFLGFVFLPLSDEDGTVIGDKSHELYLYKCDHQLWEDESLNLTKYSSLPYGPGAKVQSNARLSQQQNFTHSSRELVTVKTFLLSTKLTQNNKLLNLLKWRELIKRNNKDFEEALKNVLNLKGEEILQFLQDILDTLFDTFTLYSTSEDDYCALIFKVLVHIFMLLDEPKYQHFKQVLDTYASAHFSATLVYKGLLACVKKCLEYSSDVERHEPIKRCFKTIRYVFQFIVQSKILYSKATGEKHDESFLDDLRHLFKLFELLLSNNHAHLIPLQVTLLESFPGAIEQLLKVMSPRELSYVISSLPGSVGFCIPPQLSKAILIFMKEAANSELIKNQDVRLHISEVFCRHLDCYIRHSEQLELCHEVLEILLVKIHDYHWPVIHRLHQLSLKSNPNDLATIEDQRDTSDSQMQPMTVGEMSIMLKLSESQSNNMDLAIKSVTRELEPFVNLFEALFQLIDSLVKDFNGERLLVQRYCNCLLTILKLMSKDSFEHFLQCNRRKMDHLKLSNLFRAFRGLYNRDWLIMQLTSHSILEHPIDELFQDIRKRCENNHLNRQLSSYIKLIVDFITHPTLQLETLSDSKRNYIMENFGDLRLKYCKQLIGFWSNLNRANICDLIPTTIQAFLDASLLQNNELQKKLIPVFWDMIDSEDQCKPNSRQFERCFIDNIDLLMNLDRGTQSFVDNFESILKQTITEKSPSWEIRGLKLVNSFTKLMLLLMEYRKSLESYEKSKQMFCLVDLLNFYKDQFRMDIHMRYLFKLCDMHLDAGNYTEAAFTLNMYAEGIRWSSRNLSQLEGFRPEEQEWRRKEALYLKIIHYFDLGKCWEETIPLCKELASFYENFLVDYEKVSSTLKKLAQFLDNILNEHRPEREYFRVEFLGAGCPDYIKGKELVYRGEEYERLAAFMQRMTSEFPGAEIVQNKTKKSITNESPGQYMVIANLKPIPSLQDHLKTGQRNINDKIIQYYLNNRLDTFSYDVPLIREKSETISKEDSLNSAEANVKNLWVGRYILKLKKQLPDILPCSEVISQEFIEISPINHAIETISSMNLELSKLILSYKTEPNKQISPLTMRLQGVIEASVNGGPSVLINAFLKRQPGEPDTRQDPELTVRLRDLIKQQFSILETGLTLHSKLAPPEVMPLHFRLVERLQFSKKNFSEDSSLIGNNYEIVDHKEFNPHVSSNNVTNSLGMTTGRPNGLMSHDSGIKDEVDGRDMNGNVFPEDQIYSQPIEPQVPKVPSNGSKSELSSPSRYFSHTSHGSSSLSTLAVLNNLPVNRSRVSLTPSKDPVLHSANHNNPSLNELCSRASRKLTYTESTKSPVANNSSQNSDEAPPLPPRSFASDRLGLPSRAHNRSPFMHNASPTPMDNIRVPSRDLRSLPPDPSSQKGVVINLGSLSIRDADRVLQSMDSEPPLPARNLPSNLPRLMAGAKSPTASLVESNLESNQQVDSSSNKN